MKLNEKELERRNKIKRSLIQYFQSDKGILHRERLSKLQHERMSNYAIFLNNNRDKKLKDELQD